LVDGAQAAARATSALTAISLTLVRTDMGPPR
jgi:hypothetical protein